MKWIKRILLALILVVIIVAIGGYFWVKSTAPKYSGELKITGLTAKVNVKFDEFGVPHILASNEEDAYRALGYIHAQDRLFQMSLIRLLTQGRLSEFLGEKALPTDKLMRTLSIRKVCEESAEKWFSDDSKPFNKAAYAYLDGVNYFLHNGNLPVDFKMLGLPEEDFTPADIYSTIGFMSLGFTATLAQEPIVSKIYGELGEAYLKDFGLDSLSNKSGLKDIDEVKDALTGIFQEYDRFDKYVPVPIWEGSNSWIASGSKTKSGKPILANDTHIKFGQPSVWFETELEYPGVDIYGYFLAGVPFPVVGHTPHHAWGLTIFPFDNMDMYRETVNPTNSDQLWEVDHWVDVKKVNHKIKVKGQKDVDYTVKYSKHGPIINGVSDLVKRHEDSPISLYWSLYDFKSRVLDGLYSIVKTKSVSEFESHLDKMDIIGLNIQYADVDGNIAWWACGKIPKRAPHVNPMVILDGASGKDDILGYYDFDFNPRVINPESGFFSTANNDIPKMFGKDIPGYYPPGERWQLIVDILDSKSDWTVEEMSKIQLLDYNERDTALVRDMLNTIDLDAIAKKGELYSKAIDYLRKWDGQSDINSIGTTLFNKFLYYTLHDALADELGEKDFDAIVGVYHIRGMIEPLFLDVESPWWDNISTKDEKETRNDIYSNALVQTISSLEKQLGSDISTWKWGRVHTVTFEHPIGKKKPFDKVFNIGPIPVGGANEVPNKMSYKYNKDGIYNVVAGPALRYIIDFADPNHAIGVIPTGQSGNVMSPHYGDQVDMFINGKFRNHYMENDEIKKGTDMVLMPK